MRNLVLALAIALGTSALLGGCCKKSSSDTSSTTTTPPTANTNIHRGEAEPVGCTGMKTALECNSCCDPKYWTAHFQNGQCHCIKK